LPLASGFGLGEEFGMNHLVGKITKANLRRGHCVESESIQ
jgi:hypothetical protein